MRKYALLALVTALSFGFVGCAAMFGQDDGLKDEGLGYISDMRIEKDENGKSVYYVTIRYCAKETTTLVSWRTYDKLWLDKRVYLKLLTADNPDVATYIWWTTDGSLDKALFVDFKNP